MHSVYARDLDLNLLRVFVVVAETGSVTTAAGRLYLTQPAVSAALRRLSHAVSAPLFTRAGRGLALTARGKRLLAAARPHLEALVNAALSPAAFEPRTSDRTVRIGLSDASEAWLLPPLLGALATEAPGMRVVALPVQFRSVADVLGSGRADLAVTVADEMPAGTMRRPLFTGGFVCLFDPRHVKLPRRPSRERYLEEEHVVVSYNGDLRGIVEDLFGVSRKVRVSVPTFHGVGAVVASGPLVATVPEIVAAQLLLADPRLRTAEVPFPLVDTPLEMLWPGATDDDPALAFVRAHVVRIAEAAGRHMTVSSARKPR